MMYHGLKTRKATKLFLFFDQIELTDERYLAAYFYFYSDL